MKQERKKGTKKGECSSKMISFRADKETLNILEKANNKGRLINQLVQQWKGEQ